jgi:hypothetical protein
MKRIIIVTLAVSLLAACGGPGKEEPPAAPGAPAPTPAPAPEAAPAEALRRPAAGRISHRVLLCHGPDAMANGKDLT